MLPQTSFRLWGIQNISIKNVFQVVQPMRHPNDLLFHESLKQLTKVILEHSSLIIADEIQVDSKMTFSEGLIIVDGNYLHLSHHFPKIEKVKNLTVLDYSTLGHKSLLASDTQFPKEFARSVLRNVKFSRKYHPKAVIHWDDYAKNRKSQLINFGWDHQFIDTSRIREKSQSFLNTNSDLFPELQNLDIDSGIILISPHVSETFDDVMDKFKYQLRNDLVLESTFKSTESILIKQHRMSEKIFPKHGDILGTPVLVAHSQYLRLLPIEILILGTKSTFLYTSPSSAAFAFNQSMFLEMQDLEKNDLSEYGLMMKRRNRN